MRLAGDPSITTLHSSITFRDELYTTWGDHVDLPLGFSESLIKWTSLAWQVGQRDDSRRGSCERDIISTGIRWYLRWFTLGVHGI